MKVLSAVEILAAFLLLHQEAPQEDLLVADPEGLMALHLAVDGDNISNNRTY